MIRKSLNNIFRNITLEGNYDKDSVRIIQDLNADGYPDIIFMVHVEDSPSIYKVLNGKDGSEIFDIEREGTSLSLTSGDFDSDGEMESIVFYAWGKSGPRFELISGRTSDTMWNYQEFEETWMLQEYFGISEIMPACPLEPCHSGRHEASHL